MSFGQFVVGGNFVVGIVVFLVLDRDPVHRHQPRRGPHLGSHGAVHPRRDARPADGDRRRPERRHHRRAAKRATRRERVRREADFYGAMDGAIRFTQRDALAAVLITGVNIVAGLIIGVFQHGLDLATAAQTYTILTVGEGLVTAIPALLVSMSGGSDHDARGVRVAPRRGSRRAVAGAAAAAGGRRGRARRRWRSFPACRSCRSSSSPALLGARGLRQPRAERRRRPKPRAGAPAAGRARTRRRRSIRSSVEVGYALVALVDEKQGGTLLTRVRAIRQQIADRDRRRRAAGARRRQPAARAAHLRDPGQGRRSRARRALSPIACWRSTRAPRDAARRHRRRASRRSACRPCGSPPSSANAPRPPATPWSIRRPRCRRTCPRRSARSCRTCSAGSRRRSWSIASARRRRSWSKSSCRSWCRLATSSACCGSCCASACRSAT